MLYLIAAVCCSAAVSLLMRISEGRSSNRTAMLVFNYAACTVCGLVTSIASGESAGGDGFGYALWLGAVGGVLFLAALALLQSSVRQNGVILSGTYMKLGVLIPTLMAMFVFGEQLKRIQLAGIFLAVISVVLMNYRPEKSRGLKGRGLLLLLLLTGGMADSMTNIFDKTGNPALSGIFLTAVFGFALILALIGLFLSHKPVGKYDIVFGFAVGLPNFFSSRFAMAALRQIKASVVYPVCNVGAMAILTLAGAVFFKEKLTRREGMALVMIAAALVFLNL